jgi:hypothetical protein
MALALLVFPLTAVLWLFLIWYDFLIGRRPKRGGGERGEAGEERIERPCSSFPLLWTSAWILFFPLTAIRWLFFIWYDFLIGRRPKRGGREGM